MAKKTASSARKTVQNETANSMPIEKWLPWALAALAFILFSIGLKNEMLSMDDHSATLDNPAVTEFALFSNYNLGMYAPVTWLGYAIAYTLGGENVFWYHLLSVLVHSFNVYLVFTLFRRLGSNLTMAGLVAFFFAIHPLQVESVAWIAGFSTPLFSMFVLLSMLFYVEHTKDEAIGKNYWISIAMFLLACLSKSAAVTLPLTLVVLDWWLKRPTSSKTWTEKIPYFAISLGFGVLTLMSRQHAGQLDQPADFNLLDRVLMASQTILFYWKKILLPTGLSIWYPFEKHDGVWDWTYYASPVILAAIVFGAWRSREKMPILWFGVLFYLSNVILSLPWATFGTFELRSDRYNYLAMLGILAIIAALPAWLSEKKPNWMGSGMGALIVVSFIWLFTAGSRISDWKNTVTLIESALATTGDNFGKAYLWRGTILADEGKGDPAIQDLNKAIAKNPLLYDAFKYRGNIMGLRQNFEQSVADLTKYIDHNPNAAPEIYNRGLSYVNLGKDAEALADFNKCLEIDAKFARAYRARGNTYLKMGQKEKGDADLKQYDVLMADQQ